MDVYLKHHPEATEAHLVNVGRLFTLLLSAASVLWLPVIDGTSEELFLYIQGMQVIWSAPVSVVFLGSVASERLSVGTAWRTLHAGLACGFVFWLARSGLPKAYRVEDLGSVNILHFSAGLFLADAILMYALHLLDTSGGSSQEVQALVPKSTPDQSRGDVWSLWSAALLTITVTVLSLSFWI